MKCKSLKNLTPRELVMYWLIGTGIGYLLSQFGGSAGGSFIGPILETIGGGIQLLSWIYLIWAIIKLLTNKKVQKDK